MNMLKFYFIAGEMDKQELRRPAPAFPGLAANKKAPSFIKEGARIFTGIFLHVCLYFFLQHHFRHGANLFVHHFPVFNKKNGGNGGNSKIHAHIRVKVNIEFADIYLACIFFGKLFHNRANCTSGAAPFCPEVNHGKFITF